MKTDNPGPPRDTPSPVRNRGFESNTYLLPLGDSLECVVVDPGLDHEAVGDEIIRRNLRPVAVLCTHGHFDHVGGAAALQEAYGIPVYMRASDRKTAQMANFMMMAFKIDHRVRMPDFELIADDALSIDCAGREFVFHSVPGHTPGSAAIEFEGLLFSGDSLYARKIALSRLPGEDHATLRRSLKNLFTRIDHRVLVLPGHGGGSTLGDILQYNDELNAFLRQAD